MAEPDSETSAAAPLRVILAEDIARGIGDLQALSAFPKEVTICDVARSPTSLVEQAQHHKPDLIILTEAFLGSDMVAALSELTLVAPRCRIIQLSPNPEAATAATAGSAVCEVLSDDVPASELLAAVRRAAGGDTSTAAPVVESTFHTLDTRRIQPGSRSRCQSILVFSGKGGAGKTTVATNLATGLSQRGARVAILDLDLQFGDVGLMFGLEATHTIEELVAHGDLLDGAMLEKSLLQTPWGVRALLAPSRPELADLVTASTVRAVMRELAAAYDYVVVDAACHLDERCIEAIKLADSVIVITGFTLASLRDTRATLEVLTALGHPASTTSIVLNQTRPRVSLSREEVERILGHDVLAQLPYDPRVVDEAGDSGKPFLATEPKSEIARQFRGMLEMVAPPMSGTARLGDNTSGRRRFSLGRSN